MRLIKATLKDFGQHEKLVVHFHGPVSGILGRNGRGKSTLLTAICFAFTGVLPGKAEKWVRYWGHPEKGAANGSVEIEFEQGGTLGTIMRQIGKTPKRQLTWDGQEIKASAKVDALLQDILHADKKAIASAVFIKQSELDALLFGDQSEREELFVKVLLMSHMQKVSEAADSRIALLLSELSDNTALLDSLRDQRRAGMDELEVLQRVPLVDYATSVALLQDWNRHLQTYNTSSASVQRLSADAERYRQGMRDWLLQQNLNPDTAPDTLAGTLRHNILQDETASADWAHKINLQRNRLTNKQTLASWQGQLASVETREAPLHQELQLIGSVDENRMNQLRNDINALMEKQRLEKRRNELAEELTQKGSMAEELQKNLQTAEPELERLTAARQAARDEYSQLRPTVELMDRLKNISGCCPTCASKVDLEKLAELEQAGHRERLAQLLSEGQKLTSQVDQAAAEVRRLQQTLSAAQQALTSAGQELARISQQMPVVREGANLVADNAELGRLMSAQSRHSFLQQALSKLQGERVQLETNIQSISQAERIEVESATQEQLNEMLLEQNAVQVRLTGARNTLATLTNSLQEIGRIQGQMEEANTQMNSSHNALKALETQFTPLITNELNNNGNNSQIALEALQLKQQGQDTHLGTIAATQRTVQDITRRIEDLERKEMINEDKRRLAAELEQIKNAFARKGIPLAYITDRFQRLASLTRANLERLEADFTVDVDETKAVTFTFQRTDDDSGYVMEQSMLSGGQRVRLSVAFLLAVQQLIIPEVGLLVLDEPSVHLDDQGVEQLRELLDNMGQTLQNSGAQVIVCDHNTMLQSAFTSVVTL